MQNVNVTPKIRREAAANATRYPWGEPHSIRWVYEDAAMAESFPGSYPDEYVEDAKRFLVAMAEDDVQTMEGMRADMVAHAEGHAARYAKVVDQ